MYLLTKYYDNGEHYEDHNSMEIPICVSKDKQKLIDIVLSHTTFRNKEQTRSEKTNVTPENCEDLDEYDIDYWVWFEYFINKVECID